MDDERFDGMYMNMAGQLGGIDPLLDGLRPTTKSKRVLSKC